MADILIVDDDEALGKMLCEYLQPEGFSVTVSLRGDDGLVQAQNEDWDAIVLDIMLPGMNGIEVLKQIRKKSLAPVIILAAKGDDFDKILGLEMGADDYMPKPFNPRELVARLRAILRRQIRDRPVELTCRTLSMNPKTRRVLIDCKPVDLTSTEFSVLLMLVENAGNIVSKEALYQKALGKPLTPHDRCIDVHISHLRSKLSNHDTSLIIHTIRGSGYQMAP